MEPEVVAEAVIEAPPVVTEPAEDSIADHEKAFGKGAAKEPPPVEDKTRHRAKSQGATPADAPRIAELTKKWRDAERRAEEAERRANARQPETDRRAPDAAAERLTPQETAKPADKPSWKTFEEQIGEKYPTWGDAQDAYVEAYVDARDAWKEAQGKKTQEERQQSSAQHAVLQSYSAKAQEYAKSTPDFFDKMAAAAPILDGLPALLYQAIVRDDNGPEIAYYLVTHPSDLDDMWLAAHGKDVDDPSVAVLQRRLSHYRVLAAATGSAAAPKRPIAPRPPNPVRTGPIQTGDEIPDDDSSLAAHEHAFGPKRRR